MEGTAIPEMAGGDAAEGTAVKVPLVSKGQHATCPYCKLLTEQIRVVRGVRRCMGCGKEFTLRESRKAEGK